MGKEWAGVSAIGDAAPGTADASVDCAVLSCQDISVPLVILCLPEVHGHLGTSWGRWSCGVAYGMGRVEAGGVTQFQLLVPAHCRPSGTGNIVLVETIRCTLQIATFLDKILFKVDSYRFIQKRRLWLHFYRVINLLAF